jgi:hypothetical protein
MPTLKYLGHIDNGGFGCVDLVETEDGTKLARKTFAKNQPLSDDLLENVLKRFGKEVRVQKSILHQNIVPIVDFDLAANPPYYLMPVADSNLGREVAKNKTLEGQFVAALRRAAKCSAQMLSAAVRCWPPPALRRRPYGRQVTNLRSRISIAWKSTTLIKVSRMIAANAKGVCDWAVDIRIM